MQNLVMTAALACFVAAPSATAGTDALLVMLNLSNARVSGNGMHVVGNSTGGGITLFTLATGSQPLTIPAPYTGGGNHGISEDGSTIIGVVYGPNNLRAGMKWVDGVAQVIGSTDPWFEPMAISANGQVVAGRMRYPSSQNPPGVWRDSLGFQGFAQLTTAEAMPTCLSADGRFVGGIGGPLMSWIVQDESAVRVLPFGEGVQAISADGGTAFGVNGITAVKWLSDGSFRFLTDTTATMGLPMACSADASVVVGDGRIAGDNNPIAFYWSEKTGAVPIATIAANLDLQFGATPPRIATSISSDGRTIVGTTQSTSGSWLLRLPAPCNVSDVSMVGGIALADARSTPDDLVVFLGAFFSGNMLIADICGLGGTAAPDGRLTADDVIVFLNAFFGGCA